MIYVSPQQISLVTHLIAVVLLSSEKVSKSQHFAVLEEFEQGKSAKANSKMFIKEDNRCLMARDSRILTGLMKRLRELKKKG